jgi:hypothetical protein
VWHALKTGPIVVEGAPVLPTRAFGLRVVLRVPSGSLVASASVIKPVLDGVISALHAHDGTDVANVAARLTAQLGGTTPDTVRSLLCDERAAVLGTRRPVGRPAHGAQWNPA